MLEPHPYSFKLTPGLEGPADPGDGAPVAPGELEEPSGASLPIPDPEAVADLLLAAEGTPAAAQLREAFERFHQGANELRAAHVQADGARANVATAQERLEAAQAHCLELEAGLQAAVQAAQEAAEAVQAQEAAHGPDAGTDGAEGGE